MEKYVTSIATTTTTITTTMITTMAPTTPPVVSRPLTPAVVAVGGRSGGGVVFGVAMKLLLLCGPAVSIKVIGQWCWWWSWNICSMTCSVLWPGWQRSWGDHELHLSVPRTPLVRLCLPVNEETALFSSSENITQMWLYYIVMASLCVFLHIP